MLYHFTLPDIGSLIGCATALWGVRQSILKDREGKKAKQAEAAATFSANEQTRAERERDEIKARETGLWDENKDLREGLREEIERLRKEVDNLRTLYHVADGERQTLKLAVEALSVTIKEQAELLKIEHQAREENPKLKAEVARLTKRVKELETDVDTLKSRLARYEQSGG